MRHEDGVEVEFRLLGPLELVRHGQAVAIGGARQRGLLALLLLHANQLVARERLIDGLWGDEPPETAPNSLQVAVHALRKLLGADRIVTRGRGYVLRVEPGAVDLERFERLVERARAESPAAAAGTLREALSLWRGPALADLPEAPFARRERERLDELRLAALEQRLDADLALGRHDELVAELESLVDEQPYRERLRRLLMLALYRAGRQAEALEAYQRARRAFVDELGIEPTPALQELERAILRQDPALSAPPALTSNVPAPLTPLVGRQLELAATTALLRGKDVRLLTLTGPGGIGKTRLAVEMALELGADFRDGICFVDLSPLRDPDLVGPQILRALELAEQPGRPAVATLKDALRERQLLLVLDNFEQVAEAGPLVTELLAGAPNAKSLVTSRAVLHVTGEHEYPLPPLALPGAAQRGAEALARNDAVELFTARARAVAPDFRLTAQNAPVVARICIALDGLPLAIELAAAGTRVLSADEMLGRLTERLELLVSGPRDAPARQQTLRATLDWSFELLDAEERRLYARLAVFSGGCLLEAAQAVCEASLDALASLVDKSLVRREESDNGQPRFRMLETIREYALERLEENGEAEDLRRRHADYYRTLVEDAAREAGAGAGVYERLEADLDNLRSALAWADAAGASELALETAGALKLFWRVRGHLDEGRRWLETALAHAGPDPTPARARALEAVGALAQRSGDYAGAKTFWREALDIWRSIGDERGVARSLGDLASAYDLDGDAEQALQLYEESAELLRRLGLEYELAPVVSNLGDCLMSQRRFDEAGALFEEAVELCRASGRQEQLVISTFNRGRVSALQGRHAEAAALFRDALSDAHDLGYREMIAYSLKGIGEVLAAQSETTESARLLGAADGLFGELGAHVEAIERETYARTVERLKATLGDDTFAAAHAEGRSMSLEQAVATAAGAARAGVGRSGGT